MQTGLSKLIALFRYSNWLFLCDQNLILFGWLHDYSVNFEDFRNPNIKWRYFWKRGLLCRDSLGNLLLLRGVHEQLILVKFLSYWPEVIK